MCRVILAVGLIGFVLTLGCGKKTTESDSASETSSRATMDDVKREAAETAEATAAFVQQKKEMLLAEMDERLTAIDARIEELRAQEKELASDARARWQLKMDALDEKRRLANERLGEIAESTSKAWSDVETGLKNALEELSEAVQEASSEL
jgi:TolA-binding protein